MRVIKSAPKTADRPPRWSGTFIVPTDACEACQRHEHFRCVGGDPLLDPLQDCTCNCGHYANPLRMNAKAWDDMARHVPWLIWMAVEKERLMASLPAVLARHERRQPMTPFRRVDG